MAETLENSVINTEGVSTILKEAWNIAHTFGYRGAGNESFPTYQQYNRRGLAIEVLHITDFCGVTNGYCEIKRDGAIVFNYDYGDASLAHQNATLRGGSAQEDEIRAAATKVSTLDEQTKAELSFLYDLSCAAAATFEQKALKKATYEATMERLLGKKYVKRMKNKHSLAD